MNLLKKLLFVIASAGVAGSAPALDQINPGMPSPAVKRQVDTHGASSAAMPFSFAAALNFVVDGNYRTASAGAARQAPARTGAQPTRVAGLKLDPFSVASLPHTDGLLEGAWIDMKSTLNLDGISARKAGSAGAGPDGTFPVAAAPEPDGWMQLLCGLVVVAFMARRRTNLAAG